METLQLFEEFSGYHSIEDRVEESSFKNGTGGWRGDIQWSKTLATLPEDPIAIPNAYTAAHNHQLYILGDFIPFFSLQGHQACM